MTDEAFFSFFWWSCILRYLLPEKETNLSYECFRYDCSGKLSLSLDGSVTWGIVCIISPPAESASLMHPMAIGTSSADKSRDGTSRVCAMGVYVCERGVFMHPMEGGGGGKSPAARESCVGIAA